MGAFDSSGSFPAHLQPTQGKTLYGGNYLDFFNLGNTGGQWAQQFLPDVYEKEVERYGNRTISSFLRMVSAEMPSTSDQIIWTEQGRLHTRYVGAVAVADGTNATQTAVAVTVNTNGGSTLHFYVDLAAQPGDLGSTSTRESVGGGVNFRVGQTVMIQAQGTETNRGGDGEVFKGVISNVEGAGDGAGKFSVVLYTPVAAYADTVTFTCLAYGSEFAKGTGNFTEKLDPSYSTYTTAPIIMKEHYSINGSDTSQIGWIEVTSENGANGYLWYMKSEHENRLRWEDYIEMSMVEGVTQVAGASGAAAGAQLQSFRGDFGTTGNSGERARGTEGFFAALEDRGNVYQGFGDQAAGGGALTDFDNVLRQLDKQGSIEENMIYLNRDLSLQIDDILAQQNSYGQGGTSWGVFNNSMDMALTLGFSGFRRGSYDFYKTDWKYLNDWSTRGGFGNIEGVMIPAGTSTVYDQNLGQNIKRPFLHVRYRSSEADNRKMKSWITGSVGGAYTTDVDEMRIHYLTERCLVTQAANNFVLFRA